MDVDMGRAVSRFVDEFWMVHDALHIGERGEHVGYAGRRWCREDFAHAP